MVIKFFCPRWGCEHLSYDTFFGRVKAAGYDGVEMSVDSNLSVTEGENITNLLKQHGLLLIGQHWQTVEPDINLHKSLFKKQLYKLISLHPLFINTQTGKDYFTEADNISLINIAEEISKETGIAIYHETHRGKWSFAAHVTRAYLKKYPYIKLTLDISHWCAVAESFLQDQQDAVDIAIKHTHHLHARVGFTQGPQVTDPRAPEWQEALDYHLQWWDKVIEHNRHKGIKQFTITAEFGAPPYLTLMPYSQQPVADQWDMNVFMMNMLKSRYKV